MAVYINSHIRSNVLTLRSLCLSHRLAGALLVTTTRSCGHLFQRTTPREPQSTDLWSSKVKEHLDNVKPIFDSKYYVGAKAL